MSDSVHTVVKKIWEKKEALEPGELRYLTLQLLHEIKDMPKESELDTCFTRSQIAIVKEAESLILADLSRRITAKEMAERLESARAVSNGMSGEFWEIAIFLTSGKSGWKRQRSFLRTPDLR